MQSALVLNYPLLPIPTATARPSSSFLLLLTVATAKPPSPSPSPSPSKSPNLCASFFSFSLKNPKHFSCSRPPHVLLLQCSSSHKLDSAFLHPQEDEDEDDDDDGVSIDVDMDDDDDDDDIDDVEIKIEIEKTGNKCRRIQSEIGIEAPLNTVWNLLTDYERLADFIPGLALCQLLHKADNYARIFQIGQQNLAFGLKFNAKGIVDCYETPLESLPNNLGHKRDIEFNMVEGDFEIFQGKWSLQHHHHHHHHHNQQQQQQQLNVNGEIEAAAAAAASCTDSLIVDQEDQLHTTTTLSYLVHVKPKLWLPVRLVEARLCNEIKINLACIRQQALKVTRNKYKTLHTR